MIAISQGVAHRRYGFETWKINQKRNTDLSRWFLTLVVIASNLDAFALAIAEIESFKLDQTSQVIFSYLHLIDYKNKI
ncbi:hypothetical protein [Nostoc sp. DedQUE09]|uniref:hypothetical protein n=1 Tax=Nostoc sp. DedQUE09 TaxID=3075394 RepID=UPI002AD47A53|nr:hypothetical protein [Nostoc sp. DedQUE09]MDZ7950364.1 hypothetical protein [Nostoc sp. DedQUE09]